MKKDKTEISCQSKHKVSLLEGYRCFTLIPFTLFIITITLLLSGCEKYGLDTQVRELCAKNGGIRVYETVILPPENFDKYGNINFFRTTQGEHALGPEYLFIEKYHYYRNDQPTWKSNKVSMWRSHQKIIRKVDMRLLGEKINYVRVGGEFPGPWHSSSFSCSKVIEMQSGLINQIFIKEELK